VALFDVVQSKIDFAKKLGFEHAVNSGKTKPADYIKQLTHGKDADICLEAAGVSPTLESAILCARRGGKVVAMGNPASNMTIPQKSYQEILRKQLEIHGTWNSSYNQSANDWQTAISLMENGTYNLEPMITHKFPLAECKKAFEVMRQHEEFWVKVMFIL
jgi:L-iditol 2-dehydrogenase